MPRIDGRYIAGPVSDQRFLSDGVATYFSEIIGDGVTSLGENLKVTAEFPAVSVNYGDAFLRGFLFRLIDDGGSQFSLTETSGTRKDRVVIRLDTSTGSFSVYIKQGAAEPPSLELSTQITEISLAKLTLSGESIAVTDERSMCEMLFTTEPAEPEDPTIWGGI